MPGFIPSSRGSLSLDLIAIGLLLILPLLYVSINAAKRRQLARHRLLQLCLSAILLAVIVLFEIDMRSSGWLHLAEPSPMFTEAKMLLYWIHFPISISTACLWFFTLGYAMKNGIMSPPRDQRATSRLQLHRTTGKLAAIGMGLTALTGWVFYVMAFVL